MSPRTSPLLISLFLPFVAFVLLVLIVVPVIVISIPSQVEDKFGRADSSLNFYTRHRLIFQLFLQGNSLTEPALSEGGEIPFQISPGESTASIIQRLSLDGMIENPGAFRAYLQYTGLDKNIQAGDYSLSPSMTPLEIAGKIQDATPEEITFVILPGWRSEEIADSLPTSGLDISSKAFTAAIRIFPVNQFPEAGFPDKASLEGFLFPGSYDVPRQINAPDLIEQFLLRYDSEVTSEMRQAFNNLGFTLYEATTLASIIEREAVMEDEMPLIASVFINRLQAGMSLASDPTVQYALGYNETQETWWTNPLTLNDLKVDSLYNTYIYGGLPPGPISNPGIDALRAAAFPAQTPYYYFRSACDESGKHVFSETYDEHVGNACP